MTGEPKKISKDAANRFEKHGIDLWDYFGDDGPAEGDVLYLETKEGHMAEFLNEECTFFYYVLSGEGSFYLDREEIPVEPGDLIHAPPGTKIYYLGEMEMLLFCAPSWTPEQEVHVRAIDGEQDHD